MLPAGLVIVRYAYRFIVTVPKSMLVPTVAFMTVIGSYAIRNNISDVVVMIVLGVFGWGLGRFGFAVSPIVLGLILGAIAEQGFVQAWTIGRSEEHTSELQSLMRISYAVFCLKKKKKFIKLYSYSI